MAKIFNSADFRASPFMRALLEDGALPKYEKNLLDRQRKADDEELNRVWRTRAEAAFHEARAADNRYYLARILIDDWRPGHPRTIHLDAAHDRAVAVLIDAIDQWAKIPKPKKFARERFAKHIKEFQRGASCSGLVQTWNEREAAWLATVTEVG